jgi:hypothetical protein
MMAEKDAFDLWWEWATKDRATDYRTIDAKIHNVVVMLIPEERAGRATVNEAVRTQMSPLRPAGSPDEFEVPRADEDGNGGGGVAAPGCVGSI